MSDSDMYLKGVININPTTFIMIFSFFGVIGCLILLVFLSKIIHRLAALGGFFLLLAALISSIDSGSHMRIYIYIRKVCSLTQVSLINSFLIIGMIVTTVAFTAIGTIWLMKWLEEKRQRSLQEEKIVNSFNDVGVPTPPAT